MTLMGNRSDLDAYNRESLKDLSDERIAELSPDKQEQVRATKKSEGLYGGIMASKTRSAPASAVRRKVPSWVIWLNGIAA